MEFGINRIVKIGEAAKLFGCSVSNFRKLHSKNIPGVRIGQHKEYMTDDIIQYKKSLFDLERIKKRVATMPEIVEHNKQLEASIKRANDTANMIIGTL